MIATKETVLEAARKPSVSDRSELVDDLVVSLQHDGPPGADIDWDAAIERRSREIDEGTAVLKPWDEVKALARKEAEKRG